MTKKKNRNISTIELFIWRGIGFMLFVAWILAIIATFALVNQYGWYNAGFIYFYLFLVLVPLSYSALYISIARLKPKGLVYGISVFVLLLGVLPFAFFVSFFIRTGLGPTLTLALVSSVVTFGVYLLHKKSTL